MADLTTTALAEELGLSKGRISQLVKDGRLDGCYSGDGRARRFDLARVADALGRKLDKGQLLGNGADTKRRLKELGDDRPAPAAKPKAARKDAPLKNDDPDRYEMARTQKAEEETRRLRRQNQEAEGTLVLASSVRQQVSRQLTREIAQFEAVLRDGARRIADQLGVDYRTARQILIETWRGYRTDRSEELQSEAASAGLSDDEQDADF